MRQRGWKILAAASLAFFMALSAHGRPGGKADGAFIIQDVTFRITGRTWERALEKKIDIHKGRTFATIQEVEAYLKDREQLVRNQRVLSEGKITYTTSALPDGKTAVHVTVETRDTWNVVLLPYFKYDSNSGLLLSIRARDFNFLGSMEALKLNLDYTFTDTGDNEFGNELTFTVPFRLVDKDWRFGLSQGLTYNAGTGDYIFNLTTSMAVDFPVKRRDWTLEFSQSYLYDDTDSYGDHQYHQSKIAFDTDFDLPWTLGRLGNLRYGPGVFAQVKYRFDRSLSDRRRGVEPGFTHSVFVERVDWHGNFRDGAALSLGNTLIYNPVEDLWRNSIDWSAAGHKAFSWVGFSGRFSGFFQFDRERGPADSDAVGAPIRGILDDRLKGDSGLFVNTDIDVKMWMWFLDPYFEVQAGPFLDLALVKRRGESFNPGEMYYGGGVQVVVFPKFARSLYLRASLGFDLEAVLDDYRIKGFAPREDDDGKRWKRWEAFIGFGHHY